MKHLILLLVLMLGACMSAPPSRPAAGRPAEAPPIGERPAPVISTPRPQPSQVPPPVAPAPPRPASSDATDALILASNQASARGDHRTAIASLERAIRIDGRNADLWARLSTAYLRDGRTNLARQYANRAMALAGSRLDWKRAAWLAVAAIEEAAGNLDEAERIRAQYRTGNG